MTIFMKVSEKSGKDCCLCSKNIHERNLDILKYILHKKFL